MASSKGDYLEKKVLNLLGGTSITAPATHYLRLWTTLPNAAGTGGTEVTGGSYVALAVTANSTNWPAASGSNPASISNGVIFTFATPTATWGTVAGVTLEDAASAGNMLYRGNLTVNKTINSGDTVRFGVGALVVTEV